ncbi:O-antigen ligase family protein [Flavobacterium marginilacus]|uniref:O-antigen ligase family protein n=1 Tax=Flavobacterium marginilacus TaxID=3003256 RepID=UPI00248D96E2|nr:O-antigen ligase family protein [Flavobacterium marginilacus]
MLKKTKFIHIYEFYLATLFVYTNGSWLYFAVDKIILLGLQLLSIVFYIFLQHSKGEKIRSPNGLALFFILMPFFSKIINLNINSSLVNTFSSAAVYLSLSCLSYQKLDVLLDRYARVIFFLCLVTLVIAPITLVNYSLLSTFPISTSGFDIDGYGFYNLIIYTDRVSNDFRAQSIFWEPGAWSFSLSFAFYWLVIEKRQYKKIPYFLFGVLLASSTTGFFLLMLILIHILLNNNDKKVKKTMITYLSFSVLLVTSGIIYLQTSTNIDVGELIYDQTLGKLMGTSEASALSLTDRVASTQKAFNIAIDNPFFGVGKLGAEDSLFVTSSIAEISYQLGLIFLLVYLFVFRQVFKKLGIIISCVFMIVLLNGEAISYFILCSLILIYGTKKIMIKKREIIL